MPESLMLAFDDAAIAGSLDQLDDEALDVLEFGVIGFDKTNVVRRYNAFESRCAGISRERVLGQALFTNVAPCMNNFMVAHRFEEAAANGTALDETIPYVLTLRMRPTKVRLRLLASPTLTLQYVLVNRLP
ncbi:phosphonate transporter [Noviherbaspirillum galbum]|uniref:Phosphonate transporter n=1 Tax=Noviherbaspirillum galbum TaxID=2709383 RepID=A0A6B3SGU7_9BURK|nr:phosphonate transporter [Noviherbaspirillum galbum]NEX59843.1 phosphonate transporter [Noviherbaspirillum galbum]